MKRYEIDRQDKVLSTLILTSGTMFSILVAIVTLSLYIKIMSPELKTIILSNGIIFFIAMLVGISCLMDDDKGKSYWVCIITSIVGIFLVLLTLVYVMFIV